METEKFGDLLELGIIDPVSVTKVALRNALSIALLISSVSGSIVLEKEKEEEDKEE